MSRRRFPHVIGIDDAPFDRSDRGDILVVATVFAGSRLEGVLSTRVQRDGEDATEKLIRLIDDSRFRPHLSAVLLQGITLAGFNVVDIQALSESLALPVLVVCRQQPDMARIRQALLGKVPGGKRKWALIEKAGSMEPLRDLYVQRAGLSREHAADLLEAFTHHSLVPEPLRAAHLIAGGVATGESRHRV